MNHSPNDPNLELLRLVRMLDKAAEMAQEAELTGNLASRSAAAVRTYNATLKHLADTGGAPTALFAPLPDDASLTDVGISSAQLAEYLRAGLPEPQQGQENKTRIERNLTIGNLNLGAGDKDELAQMVREHLSEWLHEARPDTAPAGAEQPAASAAAPTSARGDGEPTQTARLSLPPQQARVEETQPEQRSATRR